MYIECLQFKKEVSVKNKYERISTNIKNIIDKYKYKKMHD